MDYIVMDYVGGHARAASCKGRGGRGGAARAEPGRGAGSMTRQLRVIHA